MQPKLQFISIAVVLVLGFCAVEMNRQSNAGNANTNPIRVYCAAGFAETIEELIREFNLISETQAKLARSGGSGELAGQIKMEFETGFDRGADIFISADDFLIENAQANGIIGSAHPIANQRLVIAVLAENSIELNSLSDLLQQNLRFGIASNSAAAGRLTRVEASRAGILDALETHKTLDAENVMTLAQALVTGSLDAVVIWDTTLSQINRHAKHKILLKAAEVIPGGQAKSNLTAGILETSLCKKECKKLIQFLTASKFSREHLQSSGYNLP